MHTKCNLPWGQSGQLKKLRTILRNEFQGLILILLSCIQQYSKELESGSNIYGTPAPTQDRIYKTNNITHLCKLRLILKILKELHLHEDKLSVWYQ
jgi:hypothetical protein